MAHSSMVFVYHPQCNASIELLTKTKELNEITIDYVNLEEDKIETKLNVDIVPMIIIDNSEELIYKGKDAFDKIEHMLQKSNPYKRSNVSSGLRYGKGVVFVEEESKANKKKDKDGGDSGGIDLSKRPNV